MYSKNVCNKCIKLTVNNLEHKGSQDQWICTRTLSMTCSFLFWPIWPTHPLKTLTFKRCSFLMHSAGPEIKHEAQLSYFYSEWSRVSYARGRWQLLQCTSRFHLSVIVLGESVGGAIRVFLNRLWVQWWRDRTQCDITWIHTQTHTRLHTETDTQGQTAWMLKGRNNEPQWKEQKESYQVFCVSV